MFCDILFGIIGIILLTFLSYNKKGQWKEFKDTLDKNQKLALDNIYMKRIWLLGFSILIGIILSFLFIYFFGPKKIYSKICLFITILFFSIIAIYTIFPKNDYLVYHLNKNQIKYWYSILDHYKFLIVIGFLVGLIFYFLLNKLINRFYNK